ncbi:MAG: hypothetical protein IBX64_06690 [Actinobacteria bacterium]|nr:hypothetical protein [Actinomycetota bacterium]
MRKKAIVFILAAMLLSFNGSAWAWNGISHYHINRGVGIEPADVFGINGTGPDMSVQWIGSYPRILDEDGKEQNWSDYFHSPNPKYEGRKRPIADKPNFAYLMLKVSGRNGTASDRERAQALGWGGHIAADWVAHSDNLFPICPTGSTGEKKHFVGECMCELYSFLTKGPITSSGGLSIAFNDRQIYKALYNYRLIAIHEHCVADQQEVSDQELKSKALKTTLPKSTIRQRIKKWAAKLAVIQFAYSKSPVTVNPINRLLFIEGMKQKDVESNFSLSEMSVYAWVNNPKPRGGIPNYSRQVVPFYGSKLMDIPEEAALGSLVQSVMSISSVPSPVLRGSSYQPQQIDTMTAEERDEAFWQEIVNTACQEDYLTINDTETTDGLYLVDVVIKDEDGLWSTVEEAINESTSPAGEQVGIVIFWKKLLLEGISDPDVLADIAPPTLELISPADNSFVNTATPELAVRIGDDPDGTGVDLSSIALSVDGIPVNCDFSGGIASYRPSPSLEDGLHRARISARDKAGNESHLEWSFTVDTIPPELHYKVINRVINKHKQAAKVAITANEPVGYRLTVLPVAADRTIQDTVILQRELGQQDIVSWDGTNSSGERVTAGNYLMRTQAIDRAGNVVTLDVSVKVKGKI